ncbi:MAG: hypothetical protein OXN96_15085 [Bryobacterales bacterium]|nr:hypothetical protein [Bryobacterales bacterium]
MALAHLLAEVRCPSTALWDGSLVASRLVEYEIWARLHAYKLPESHGEAAHGIIECIALVELLPPAVERASDEFPYPVSTLDSVHLATFH